MKISLLISRTFSSKNLLLQLWDTLILILKLTSLYFIFYLNFSENVSKISFSWKAEPQRIGYEDIQTIFILNSYNNIFDLQTGNPHHTFTRGHSGGGELEEFQVWSV